MNPIQQVQSLGQSVWYDNVRRGLLTSGELKRLIALGVTGVTSNPTIFEKAIAGSTDYDQVLLGLAREGKSALEVYEALAIEDLRAAADLLLPIYERTKSADGYASLEVSPALAHDTGGTIKEAHRLFSALDRPNVMIKVPATPEGVPAVQHLIGDGVNVNVTLIFSLDAYRQVMEAYIRGLEDLAQQGGDVGRVSSVASFFVSRVDTAVDKLLEERIRKETEDLKPLLGTAAIANARLAYEAFKATFGGERFAVLRAQGAQAQRPLWASTGTKNPAYSDVLYLETLIGPDTVNTMPPATLTAFLEHGRAKATLDGKAGEAGRAIASLEAVGVNVGQVTQQLLADGVEAFADSFDKLLANIEEKKTGLLAGKHEHPGVALGVYEEAVEAVVVDLQERDVPARIWRKDHTVWKPDPIEIVDRLGWLSITDAMSEQVSTLGSFAEQIRHAGYRNVVLLGMGGSSLAPEVMRQTFGSAAEYPNLIVLDSTVPDWVREVRQTIDPARTLFLVSSKSGTTMEPLAFYSYFRGLVEEAVGREKAGQSFVAITDPGTPLERLAQEYGFRCTFLNPPDGGGRYSALSYFGLVPAALMGIDVATLLYRADCMREGCAPFVPPHENPGVWLGAILGSLALEGRNKLTIVTSPSIGSFGLWVEQLIAESTGKQGKGIIPVAGEPLADPASYDDDRLFVYLRVVGDDNGAADGALERIAPAGQPVVRLDLRDKYDLGGEFFRWEFATAMAVAILGIHPFDQPNVQQAKDLTAQVLQEYQAAGEMPVVEAHDSVAELLAKIQPGDYLAIMAYARQTPELDQAIADLRRVVMERYRIATTLGYGPRFLHSTGQLHKGGPDSGVFLQVTTEHPSDLPIPGESYTFGALADAQALGDLRALQAQERRVARVYLGAGGVDDIKRLTEELGS